MIRTITFKDFSVYEHCLKHCDYAIIQLNKIKEGQGVFIYFKAKLLRIISLDNKRLNYFTNISYTNIFHLFCLHFHLIVFIYLFLISKHII